MKVLDCPQYLQNPNAAADLREYRRNAAWQMKIMAMSQRNPSSVPFHCCILIVLVVLNFLVHHTAAGDGRSSGVFTVIVTPHKVNDTSGCRLESGPTVVCFCVQSALRAIETQRQGDTPARILLAANRQSNCSLPLTRSAVGKGVTINQSNVEICIQHGSDCEHAGLSIPSSLDTSDTDDQFLFRIHNVTKVILRGIRFDTVGKLGALKIQDTLLLKVEHCYFILHGRWPRETVVFVASSEMVVLLKCRMERDTLSAPWLSNLEFGALKTIKSPVRVDGGFPSMFSGQSPTLESSVNWLVSSLPEDSVEEEEAVKDALGRLAGYRERFPIELSVTILLCDFVNIGVVYSAYSQLEMASAFIKGGAVHFSMMPRNMSYIAIVSNCTFTNISGPESSAVAIRYKAPVSCGSGSSSEVSRCGAVHVLIRHCKFYDNRGLSGGALSVRFERHTVSTSIEVEHTDFKGNHARQTGGGVFVRFTGRTQKQNAAAFRECRFVNNIAGLVVNHMRSSGGGMMVFSRLQETSIYTPKKVLLSGNGLPVELSNCHFQGNLGFGGFFSRSVAAGFYNTTTLTDNIGTGLVAANSHLLFHGDVTIQNNTGLNGGGIHIAEFGQIDFTGVDSLSISGNSAYSTGRAVYIARLPSAVSLDTLYVYIGRKLDYHYRPCPILMPANNMTSAQILLENNFRSDDPSTDDLFYTEKGSSTLNEFQDEVRPAIYSGSWHKCFGAFGITDGRFSSGNFTTSPYCPPYPPAAWSVHHPGQVSACRYNSSTVDSFDPKLATITWVLEGSAAITLTSSIVVCVLKGNNDFLNQPAVCRSFCQNITVVNELNLYQEQIQTAPAWIFFSSASTSCYKEAGDKVWFFRGCSRDKIFRHALDSKNSGQLLRYDCSLFSSALFRYRFGRSLIPILPGYKFLLTPWSSVVHSWHSYAEESLDEASFATFQDTCTIAENTTISNNSMLGDLTLYPASGEQFDLCLDVVDEFLSTNHGTLKVSVWTADKSVLLGQDGRKRELGKSIFYPSTDTLKGLSLSGIPGTKGFLEIEFESKNVIRHLNHRSFNMKVPFKLRPCLLGFRDPVNKDKESVTAFVKNWSSIRSTSKASQNVYLENRLDCRCPDWIEGVHGCQGGDTVLVDRGYWAGKFSHKPLPDLDESCVFDRSQFMAGIIEAERDTCGAREANDFVIGLCDNGLCYNQDNDHAWEMSKEEPCLSESKRTGPRCGNCKNGYKRIISSEECQKCPEEKWSLRVLLYLFLLFVLSLLFFIALLLLNVGISPTLNTWLLYMEVVFIISADNVTMRTVFYSCMTLGLGHICIKESLTALEARAIVLAHPLFMISFIVVIWLAVRHSICARYLQYLQTRNSLAHVVWLCVIYCSVTLAFISTSLLASSAFISFKGYRYVLFLDGSVDLFSTPHLPYALLAIGILLVLVFPIPLIMAVPKLRSLSYFKWYTDEAMVLYDPQYYWCAAVDIGRRVLLACILGGINNSRLRNYLIAAVCMFMLGLHVSFRPLRRKTVWRISDIDNKFESLVLFVLCMMSVAKVGASCPGWPTALSGSFTRIAHLCINSLTTLLSILLTAYRFLKSFHSRYRQSPPSRTYSFEGDNDGENPAEASQSQEALSLVHCPPSSPYVSHNRKVVELTQMDKEKVPNTLRDRLLAEYLTQSQD